MKVLIWTVCLFVATILKTLLSYITGIKVGYLVFYLVVVFIANKLCDKWEEYKKTKEINRNSSLSMNAHISEETLNTDEILFCRKCGEKLTDNSKFCRKCGTKVLIASTAEIQTQKCATVIIDKTPKKYKYKILLYGVCGTILVATIWVLIFIISGPNYSDKIVDDTNDSYLSTNPKINDDKLTNESQNANKLYITQNSNQNDTKQLICLNTDCENSVFDSGEYCSEHKCSKSDCKREKTLRSPYCTLHSCSYISCDNLNDETGLYCIEHTCVENNCSYQKSFGSQYCSTHKCMYAGCQNGRYEYSFYCFEHKCIESGCNSQRSALSDYCLLHD